MQKYFEGDGTVKFRNWKKKKSPLWLEHKVGEEMKAKKAGKGQGHTSS